MLEFAGIYGGQSDNGFKFHHYPYIDRLKQITSNSNFKVLGQ